MVVTLFIDLSVYVGTKPNKIINPIIIKIKNVLRITFNMAYRDSTQVKRIVMKLKAGDYYLKFPFFHVTVIPLISASLFLLIDAVGK